MINTCLYGTQLFILALHTCFYHWSTWLWVVHSGWKIWAPVHIKSLHYNHIPGVVIVQVLLWLNLTFSIILKEQKYIFVSYNMIMSCYPFLYAKLFWRNKNTYLHLTIWSCHVTQIEISWWLSNWCENQDLHAWHVLFSNINCMTS